MSLCSSQSSALHLDICKYNLFVIYYISCFKCSLPFQCCTATLNQSQIKMWLVPQVAADEWDTEMSHLLRSTNVCLLHKTSCAQVIVHYGPSRHCLSLLAFKHNVQQIVYLTERTNTAPFYAAQSNMRVCTIMCRCMDLVGPVACVCVFVCF